MLNTILPNPILLDSSFANYLKELTPILKLLWSGLALPLLRLLVYLSIGLLLANIIEAFNWSRSIARLSSPFVKFAHLGEVAATSFALAFFSAQSANALLAEGVEDKRISPKELILANLFNSSPTFLVHLPTLLSLSVSLLGKYAFIYVGLTFLGSILRTLVIVVVGRFSLPPIKEDQTLAPHNIKSASKRTFAEAYQISIVRFKKRIKKLIKFTVPIYILFFGIQQLGYFKLAELWISDNFSALSFLKPEAVSIVVLNLAAESGAAMSAASALLQHSVLPHKDIIIALLIGNILSSPMRAVRHQYPAYVGYFSPALAFQLVIASQSLRALSLIVVTAVYGYFA